MTAGRMVTAQMLRKLGACPVDREKFEREWPDGAEVTEANLRRALELGLGVGWLVRAVLTDDALAEHGRVSLAAWHEFWRSNADGITRKAHNQRLDDALIDALLHGAWREDSTEADAIGALADRRDAR